MLGSVASEEERGPGHRSRSAGSGAAIAVVLAAAEPERLYTGLSLLVSSAAEGAVASGLVTFRALDLLVDPELRARTLDPGMTPGLTREGRTRFARSLVELRAAAAELDGLSLFACSASIETLGLDPDHLPSPLDGIRSMPRFLRETAEARLVVV
jgi:peroxiredoxin family protein